MLLIPGNKSRNGSYLIKKKYGDKLVLHGGINAVLWDKVDEVTEAIIQNVPF